MPSSWSAWSFNSQAKDEPEFFLKPVGLSASILAQLIILQLAQVFSPPSDTSQNQIRKQQGMGDESLNPLTLHFLFLLSCGSYYYGQTAKCHMHPMQNSQTLPTLTWTLETFPMQDRSEHVHETISLRIIESSSYQCRPQIPDIHENSLAQICKKCAHLCI